MSWDNIKYLFQIPVAWFRKIHDRVYKAYGVNFLTVNEGENGGTEFGVDENMFAQMVQAVAPTPTPTTGYTGNVDIVTNVTWNGSSLIIAKARIAYSNGVATGVTTQTSGTIGTVTYNP